jgi:hypothetical protein
MSWIDKEGRCSNCYAKLDGTAPDAVRALAWLKSGKQVEIAHDKATPKQTESGWLSCSSILHRIANRFHSWLNKAHGTRFQTMDAVGRKYWGTP